MANKLRKIFFQKDISGYLIAAVVVYAIAAFIFADKNENISLADSVDYQKKIISGCEISQKKFGGLSNYWLKKCIDLHNKRYKKGEPSFATHSWEEAWSYMNDEERTNMYSRIAESRSSAAGKSLLSMIDEDCQQIMETLIVIDRLRVTKNLGMAKAIQSAEKVREKVKSPSVHMTLRYIKDGIEELYQGNDEPEIIGRRLVNECKKTNESMFLLRE